MGEKKYKRKTYSKETEAGWFALKEFIDPLNCSTKFDGRVISINYKDVLRHHYSGTKVFPIFNFAKSEFDQHLRQTSIHYYRSKNFSRHYSGYQRSDKQAQSVVFAKDLGIKTKKRIFNPQVNPYFVFLLGIDIDGHNGENDAEGVAQLLRENYFIQSYWEPSTHFTGKHGFVKLAYRDELSLDYVKSVLQETFTLLDQKRELLGYKASIDAPCGLPMSISWNNEIQVPSDLHKVSTREFARYLEIKRHRQEGNECLSYVSSTYAYEDIEDLLKMSLPVSLKQSQCIKLPRFNCINPDRPDMRDIRYFHNLEYLDFNTVVKIRNELRGELGADGSKDKEETDFPPKGKNTVSLNAVTGPGYNFSNEGGREEVGATIVSSPSGNVKTDEDRGTYSEKIEKIRLIQDKIAQTNKFYFYYSNHLGYVPDIETAIDEYFRQGLNKKQDRIDEDRNRRFQYVKKFIDARWDLSKRGLKLDDWKDVKDSLIPKIADRIRGIDSKWIKDRKRNQVYELTAEEIAFIYFAIKKSNQSDKNKRSNKRGSFSYSQVRSCFQLIFRKSCHRAKIAKILSVLRQVNLIQLTGDFDVGSHGNRYRAVDIGD